MATLRIRTFGGLSVEDHGTPLGPAAQQPKRLALLALIARSGRQGITRDRLIACLWPESDEPRARNALNQALFGLRRDLHSDAVLEGREILRLNLERISSDVEDFETALNAGQFEQAVELYRGPLLAGVHLREGREFEEWVERERGALARRYRAALLELIGKARAAHDARAWVLRAEELVQSNPYDAAAVCLLLKALTAAGDRVGAIRAGQTYQARVRLELGLLPDPGVAAAMEALRKSCGDDHPIPSSADFPASVIKPPELPEASGLSKTLKPALRKVSLFPLRGRSFTASLMALTGIALVVFLASLTAHPTTRGGATITSIGVLPFATRGDSGAEHLGDGVARLVANGLDGIGVLRAGVYAGSDELLRPARSISDSSARLVSRFRFDRYVTGEIAVFAGRIEVRAVLHDASRDGRVLGIATASGERDSVFATAAAVTRRLLGVEPSAGPSPLVRGASESTSSLGAFQAFLEGEAFFRASQFGDAVAAYQRAVGIDTTFGLAYYRLSEALDWNAQGNLIPAAAAAALRHSERLPWRERMLLEGRVAWWDNRYDEAELKYQAITSRDPNHSDAWFQYGEVLFHSNPVRGREFIEARLPFERVVALDPHNRGALSHLARIRAFLGDSLGADSLLRKVESLLPDPSDAELALFHAAISGDRAARQTALSRMGTEPLSTHLNAVMRLAAYARDFALADSVLHRAVQRGPTAQNRGPLHYWGAVIAAAQGQYRRALKETEAAADGLAGGALELRGLLAALPWLGDSSSRIAIRAELLASAAGRNELPELTAERISGLVRWYLLGRLAGLDGRTAELASYADSLSAAAPTSTRSRDALVFATSLRAQLESISGHPSAALAQLAAIPEPKDIGRLVANLLAERFHRAMLLEHLERFDEALVMYGSLIYGDPNSLLLAAPATLHRARLLVKLDRIPEARADYGSFLRAWQHPDAALQPIVDSARQELARLPRERW
jgi:DNA-binding SARP family transcriptional activator